MKLIKEYPSTKAMIFDLDGTLLKNDKTISFENIEAITYFNLYNIPPYTQKRTLSQCPFFMEEFFITALYHSSET